MDVLVIVAEGGVESLVVDAAGVVVGVAGADRVGGVGGDYCCEGLGGGGGGTGLAVIDAVQCDRERLEGGGESKLTLLTVRWLRRLCL